jgi:hypothetical protein
VALLSVSACSALREEAPDGRPTAATPLVRVTADQVATAMQEDHFYSDYRGDTLLVQGTVSHVYQQNSDTVAELRTSAPTKVLCNLGSHSSPVHVGDTLIVSASAADAQRQESAVMLVNCSVP